MIRSLQDALSPARFGGKAAQLAEALRAGLPVPDGWALEPEAARHVAAAETPPAWVEKVLAAGPLAVRSSAVGEDGASASHAGQFHTELGVSDAHGLLRAVRQVVASATSEGAVGYRNRLGLDGAAPMGVVLQRMVSAHAAGVLFTRHPVTGAEQRLIEGSWGLGEVVVAGRVVPDRWVLAPGGAVVEYTPGVKDSRLVLKPDGTAVSEDVPAELREAPCLDAAALVALDALAAACDRVWAPPHDIEWAVVEQTVYLIQRRPITAR